MSVPWLAFPWVFEITTLSGVTDGAEVGHRAAMSRESRLHRGHQSPLRLAAAPVESLHGVRPCIRFAATDADPTTSLALPAHAAHTRRAHDSSSRQVERWSNLTSGPGASEGLTLHTVAGVSLGGTALHHESKLARGGHASLARALRISLGAEPTRREELGARNERHTLGDRLIARRPEAEVERESLPAVFRSPFELHTATKTRDLVADVAHVKDVVRAEHDLEAGRRRWIARLTLGRVA